MLASRFQQNLHSYYIARQQIHSCANTCSTTEDWCSPLHCPATPPLPPAWSALLLVMHITAMLVAGIQDLLKSIIGRKCDRNDVHPIDESARRHCESSVWHVGIGLALFHSGILSDPLAQFAVVFLPWFMTWITRACWILNWQGRAGIACIFNKKSIAEQNSVVVAWELLRSLDLLTCKRAF